MRLPLAIIVVGLSGLCFGIDLSLLTGASLVLTMFVAYIAGSE